MGHKFLQGLGLDVVDDGTSSLGIHKIAHIDTALVDEQIFDVLVSHHVAKE